MLQGVTHEELSFTPSVLQRTVQILYAGTPQCSQDGTAPAVAPSAGHIAEPLAPL